MLTVHRNFPKQGSGSKTGQAKVQAGKQQEFPKSLRTSGWAKSEGLRVAAFRVVTESVVFSLSSSSVWGCLPGGRRHRAQWHQGGRGNAGEKDGGEEAASQAGKGTGVPGSVPRLPEFGRESSLQILPSRGLCSRARRKPASCAAGTGSGFAVIEAVFMTRRARALED